MIHPEGSRAFVEDLRAVTILSFPVELLLVPGDHRLSSPDHMEQLRRLLLDGRISPQMLTLVHKECGGPALEPNTAVGGGLCSCRSISFPFACFTCLEEIIDESELRLSEELGI